MFSKVLKSEAAATKKAPPKKPEKPWAKGNQAEMAEKAKKRDPGSISSALGL